MRYRVRFVKCKSTPKRLLSYHAHEEIEASHVFFFCLHRPKRARKLPSHMRDENFEIGLTTAKTANKKETASAKTAAGGGEASKEAANEDDEDEEMASDVEEGSNFESEDDPERLWCVCQQVRVPFSFEEVESIQV